MKNIIIAKNRKNLQSLVEEEMTLYGHECDLNHIDTTLITDMSYLFNKSIFNGDISQWNTSNVTDMICMFNKSQFNGNISDWNVSNVTDMYGLFNESIFNGDISKWNVSHVTDMTAMFANSHFNGNINQWNIINVTYINNIFYHSTCEKPWWAIEDNEKREIVLDNYNLMQKLENNMSNKHITQPKKIKI